MEALTTEFAVADAKARFSELLARAEAGEEIIIRRHGKPVAKLSAVSSSYPVVLTVDERLAALDDWFRYRDEKGISLSPDMTTSDLLDDVRRG